MIVDPSSVGDQSLSNSSGVGQPARGDNAAFAGVLHGVSERQDRADNDTHNASAEGPFRLNGLTKRGGSAAFNPRSAHQSDREDSDTINAHEAVPADTAEAEVIPRQASGLSVDVLPNGVDLDQTTSAINAELAAGNAFALQSAGAMVLDSQSYQNPAYSAAGNGPASLHHSVVDAQSLPGASEALYPVQASSPEGYATSSGEANAGAGANQTDVTDRLGLVQKLVGSSDAGGDQRGSLSGSDLGRAVVTGATDKPVSLPTTHATAPATGANAATSPTAPASGQQVRDVSVRTNRLDVALLDSKSDLSGNNEIGLRGSEATSNASVRGDLGLGNLSGSQLEGVMQARFAQPTELRSDTTHVGLSSLPVPTESHTASGSQPSNNAPASLSAIARPETPAPPLDSRGSQIDANRNHAAVEQSIRLAISRGLDRASIELEPADLGRVDISIVRNGDEVQVSFKVSQAQSRELIEASLARLRDALNDTGLSLSQSSVEEHSQDSERDDRLARERLGRNGSKADKKGVGDGTSDSEQRVANQTTTITQSLVDIRI